jgi:hypothetical protein
MAAQIINGKQVAADMVKDGVVVAAGLEVQ